MLLSMGTAKWAVFKGVEPGGDLIGAKIARDAEGATAIQYVDFDPLQNKLFMSLLLIAYVFHELFFQQNL